MIFELEPVVEFIRVTAEYSNAVLVATLPYVSDFAKKLDLPVPHPIVASNVVYCGVLPWKGGGCSITIKGGWSFSFNSGYVGGFNRPHTYFGLQDPDEIPKFFGEVRMSKAEAIQLARDTIKKAGVPLEAVFAEQEPRVKEPIRIGTNTVARYQIEWLDPRAGVVGAVTMEINAEIGRVESMGILHNKHLERPPPKIAVVPPPDPAHARRPRVNPEYARRLVPIVLAAIDEYAAKLALPLPRPLTTNHVARFLVADNGGWPHTELDLTNGWRFVYRNSMVNGYYTRDSLFSLSTEQRPILIKEFTGQWNMTEAEAIELVRRTLAKLNYATNLVHVDFPPIVSKPTLPGIPRYDFSWRHENETHDDLQSKVDAEVDADKRELKSLYFDDKSLWNRPPPIDVPISLPASAETREALGKQHPNQPTR